MDKHELIFKKMKSILYAFLSEQVQEYENGTYIAISQSAFWCSIDKQELSLGIGFNHRHYFGEKDFIFEAIRAFSSMLTRNIRITHFIRGSHNYKTIVEIENNEGSYELFSSAMTWTFAIWRKTTREVRVIDPMIKRSIVKEELQALEELGKSLYL